MGAERRPGSLPAASSVGRSPAGLRATAIRPRGFCAGVDRAIDIVNQALEIFPPPLYVRKEIVHNRAVVEGFKSRGVIFVDSLDEVP